MEKKHGKYNGNRACVLGLQGFLTSARQGRTYWFLRGSRGVNTGTLNPKPRDYHRG